MLVDVLHRELNRGHDSASDVALRHVVAVWEKTGDVDVALLAAAEIDRLLAGALADQQQPAAARGQQHRQRAAARLAAADSRRHRRHLDDGPHPFHPPSAPPLLHPVNPDDISRWVRAHFHLELFRVTGRTPDGKPDATLVAARPATSALMTKHDDGK